ncbi:SixA phosphatase family protein [Algoriphagus machipongonensis]|uniref:Phosphohistidine phosphatase SixA n=1 Tax=Algoriphagus machipongonensis TaxID=388413 RepID=A3HRU4_9BACT|nr:histidine phosphatase family protein [Algoriphagus machipongonensis]EAZ82562.1 putative phosphohistidine phosphatase SixA [Algoriphagus machipongonensis]
MKQLFLLRHGEAGFSDGTDFQRQLTQRGIERLHRMGVELKSRSLGVDIMYCSTAERTMETAKIMESYLAIGEEIFLKEIYEGNLGALINLIENIPSTHNSCLIVGHNPIISLLVSHISGESYLNMQPGMMVCLDLEINEWQMVGLNTGILKEVFQ